MTQTPKPAPAKPAAPERPERLVLLAFLVVILLGGSNAVAVRFSNQSLPPFWGASLRFIAAAALFWAIVWLRRVPVPRGRALYGSLFYGALTIGVFYALMYWALTSVPASLTMVVLAIGPLLTLFLAIAHGQESFRMRGLLGALVAFGGILLAVGGQLGGQLPLLPLLALLGAATALSEGNVIFKTFPRSDPLVVNALALSMGSLLLLGISAAAGETWALPTQTATWLVTGYLVFFGSGLLFYLYLYVLQRWTASATAYSFLLFPISATLLGAWLLGEPVTGRFALGGLIVMAGVYIGALAQRS
jgi:drug/metabolite transporter (DMT)-like permease